MVDIAKIRLRCQTCKSAIVSLTPDHLLDKARRNGWAYKNGKATCPKCKDR